MSKEETVLAAFGQLNRNDEFKIITKIVSRNSKLVVRKEAYSDKATNHIEKLAKNHTLLREAVSSIDNMSVVKTLNSESDFIEFEYIKGLNVEYEAFKSIVLGDYEKTIDFIDRIFILIDSLSSPRKTDEPETVKGVNDIYRMPESSSEYINPGIIDLNLDNFILDRENKLVAFDCEWVFEKPIAKDYIKTRLLHTFFARRSDAFAFLPNKEKPFKILQDSGIQTLIPMQLYKKYSKFLTKESMKKYWKAEDIFQHYVDNHRIDTAQSSYMSFSSEELTTPKYTFPDSEEHLRNNLKNIYDSSLETNRGLQEQNRVLEDNVKSLSTELTRIKSSIPYRILRKMRLVLRKMKSATKIVFRGNK